MGKKSREFMARTKQEMIAEFTDSATTSRSTTIRPIAQVAVDEYVVGPGRRGHIVYARYVNTLSQVPEVKQILPIDRPEGEGEFSDYIFEPVSGGGAGATAAALCRDSGLPGDA